MESAFAVRIKLRDDSIIARHVFATGEDGAVQKCKGQGRVISARKVRATDVIGEIGKFKMIQEDFIWSKDQCCWMPRTNMKYQRVEQNVVMDDATVDEIVFGKKDKVVSKNRKVEQDELWYAKKNKKD